MPPKLDYIAPNEEFRKMPCGGLSWRIWWKLDGVDANSNGAVVQEIQVDVNRTTCEGKDTSWSVKYWEAFEVESGKFVPLKGERVVPEGGKFGGPTLKEVEYPGGSDQFSPSSNPNSRGTTTIKATARFIPDWKMPADMIPGRSMKVGNPPYKTKPAGDLPATQNEPAGWDKSGSEVYRQVTIHWNCCERSSSTYVVSEIGADSE